MKRLTTVVALTTMLCSGSAWAKEYGDAGTIDITGNVRFAQTTTKMTETETDADTEDNSSTDIELMPEVAFFLLPGVAILGSLELSQDSFKDNLDDSSSTSQDMAVRVGGAYLLSVGTARIGPALRVGYITTNTKEEFGGDDSEAKTSGPTVQLGGLMKLPIGSGGVVTAALTAEQEMLTFDFDGNEGDQTNTTLGLSLGVGIYF